MRPSKVAHAIALPADADPIDRVARLRIEAIEIQNAADPGKLETQVKGLLAGVKDLASSRRTWPPAGSPG